MTPAERALLLALTEALFYHLETHNSPREAANLIHAGALTEALIKLEKEDT